MDPWCMRCRLPTRLTPALLRRVSHWPDKVIERERDAAAGQLVVEPTYAVDCFDRLLNLFDFVPSAGAA